jgi:hypothetical protein
MAQQGTSRKREQPIPLMGCRAASLTVRARAHYLADLQSQFIICAMNTGWLTPATVTARWCAPPHRSALVLLD